MNTIDNILPHGKIGHRKLTTATAVLWIAALPLLLGSNRATAAAGDQPAEEKPQSIVAVFRIEGPLTEVPPDDALQMFGPPGTSLKDLIAHLSKAATDPAVKAVVVLPESEWLGSAQVEEL